MKQGHTLLTLQDVAKEETRREFIAFFPGGTEVCRWIDPWLGAFEVLSIPGKACYVSEFKTILGVHI